MSGILFSTRHAGINYPGKTDGPNQTGMLIRCVGGAVDKEENDMCCWRFAASCPQTKVAKFSAKRNCVLFNFEYRRRTHAERYT